MTYSGHKGKGYEVQVSETCGEGNAVQMITHVEFTPSSGGDAGVTVGVIDTLRERGIGPSELWCDTSYGSGHNGWEAERRGTELVSPVGGRAPAEADRADRPVKLTAADFDIDVTARRAAVCPAGHEAASEYEDARTTTTSSATTQAPTGTTKSLTPNRPHAAEPTRKALVTRESGLGFMISL